MKRRWIFLAFWMTVSACCFSQDSLNSIPASGSIPRHTIKFSPLHLFNFYPTVQLAYELRINREWSMQFDGGVVVDIGYEDVDFQNKRGYKVKLEPRRYFAFSRKGGLGFYSSVELYLNNVDFDRSSDEVQCFDPECTSRYRRTYFYTINYREYGSAFKIGMVKHFGSFLFDVSSGFGVRLIFYSAPNYVDLRYHSSHWYEAPIVRSRTALTPIVNFRLGYSFR